MSESTIESTTPHYFVQSIIVRETLPDDVGPVPMVQWVFSEKRINHAWDFRHGF